MLAAELARLAPVAWLDEDPDAVRRRLGEVFERQPFVREKGWWQRFLEWLNSLFDAPEVDAPSSSGPGWLAGLANLVIWLVLIAVAIGLVALIVHVVRNRVSGTRRPKVKPEVVLSAPELTVRQWRSLAERYEAAGEWKEAIRCRYRELVAELAQRRAVSSVPGRTTGELRSDMAQSSPTVSSAFDEVTLLFELPWYADAPTGAAENARFRERSVPVLEGARSGHFDQDELVLVAGSDDDVSVSAESVAEAMASDAMAGDP